MRSYVEPNLVGKDVPIIIVPCGTPDPTPEVLEALKEKYLRRRASQAMKRKYSKSS